MEMYVYKCPVCSFVHFVPAYWVSFSPGDEMEMEHIDMETKQDCPCMVLKLSKEE